MHADGWSALWHEFYSPTLMAAMLLGAFDASAVREARCQDAQAGAIGDAHYDGDERGSRSVSWGFASPVWTMRIGRPGVGHARRSVQLLAI